MTRRKRESTGHEDENEATDVWEETRVGRVVSVCVGGGREGGESLTSLTVPDF